MTARPNIPWELYMWTCRLAAIFAAKAALRLWWTKHLTIAVILQLLKIQLFAITLHRRTSPKSLIKRKKTVTFVWRRTLSAQGATSCVFFCLDDVARRSRRLFDRQGVILATCRHYIPVYALDAESPENHAHYYQAALELARRFGCVDVFADIGCRLDNIADELNSARAAGSDQHRFLQSLLHGKAHAWHCLICRGPPWVFDHGRFTGEESERLFSMMRHLSLSLSEMSLRKRTRTLTSYLWDLSRGKTLYLPVALRKRYERIKKDMTSNIQSYFELDAPRLSFDEFLHQLKALQVCYYVYDIPPLRAQVVDRMKQGTLKLTSRPKCER